MISDLRRTGPSSQPVRGRWGAASCRRASLSFCRLGLLSRPSQARTLFLFRHGYQAMACGIGKALFCRGLAVHCDCTLLLSRPRSLVPGSRINLPSPVYQGRMNVYRTSTAAGDIDAVKMTCDIGPMGLRSWQGCWRRIHSSSVGHGEIGHLFRSVKIASASPLGWD